MKSLNALSATRQICVTAAAHRAWAKAVANLRLASDSLDELASVLGGMRAGDFARADIEPRSALDAASIAWSLEQNLSVLECSTPPDVSTIIGRPSDVSAAAS